MSVISASETSFGEIRPLNCRSSVSLEFDTHSSSNYQSIEKTNFAVPTFSIDDKEFVLIKHLSDLWNYPSSYQIIVLLIKQGMNKSQIKSTDVSLNKNLHSLGLVALKDIDVSFYYISLPVLYSSIKNKRVFYNIPSKHSNTNEIPNKSKIANEPAKHDSSLRIFEHDDDNAQSEYEIEDEGRNGSENEIEFENSDNVDDETLLKSRNHENKDTNAIVATGGNDDKVSISQVFPQYGLVNSNTQMNHGSFNSMNPLTKLNYYKNFTSSAHKFLPNVKLSFVERELIYNSNNYSEIRIDENKSKDNSSRIRNIRKPLSKSRKHHIHVDPNSLDLNESVIPGQGYIPEFSINNYCKVPNYYVTSNHQSLPQSFNTKKLNHTSNSSFLFNEGSKMSKNIQQLVFSNDNDNYYHSKYYYTKSYRGPGSGNYKDGAMMNKINKIHLTASNKLKFKKKTSNSERYNRSLKGLVHDKFNKNFVEHLLSEQRKYAEDYSNIEMLHNNLQFNLLINTFREISEDTWKNYFKFKLTDFEQLRAIQQELEELGFRDLEIDLHNKWAKDEKLRQNTLQAVFEEEKKSFEYLQQEYLIKQKELDEQRRRQQLEVSFENSLVRTEQDEKKMNDRYKDFQHKYEKKRDDLKIKFEIKRKSLINPLPAPSAHDTPQLDIVNKFKSPTEDLDIMRHLPLHLRGTFSNIEDELPSIKKPIRYIATYPESSNAELLARIEIVKVPNANSIGWDNLKKYKSNND